MSHPARGPLEFMQGIDGKANGAGRRNEQMRIKLNKAEAAA
jgi:hypothetical protein